MKNSKKALIILVFTLLVMLEKISRDIPILDGLLAIVGIVVIIVLIVKGINKIELKLKQAQELKKEKMGLLHYESEELVDTIDNLYKNSKNLLDKERRTYLYGNIIVLLICSIVAYIVTKYFYDEKLFEEVVSWIIFLVVMSFDLYILIFFIYKLRYRYKTILGNNLINNFSNYSDFGLKYYMDLSIFEKETNYNGNKHKEIVDELLNAKVNQEAIDGYEIEDYMTGDYCDTSVQMMDSYFYRLISNGKTTYRQSVFCGNLVIIDKNEEDKNIKIIDKKINDMAMENQDVNYDFDTYFNLIENNIEDEKLILDLKNFLTEFRKKYKIKFDIIIKNKIYIKFYTKNMFEVKFSNTPINEDSIYQFYVITKFIEEILEILN